MIIISVVEDERAYWTLKYVAVSKLKKTNKSQKSPNFFLYFCKGVATGILVIVLVSNIADIQNITQMKISF